MPFQKGKGKTGGRKKGSANKVHVDIKTRIAALIDDQFEQVIENMEQLDPEKHVQAYTKLLEFVLPKQREQKLDLKAKLDGLSDDELNALIELILAKP